MKTYGTLQLGMKSTKVKPVQVQTSRLLRAKFQYATHSMLILQSVKLAEFANAKAMHK